MIAPGLRVVDVEPDGFGVLNALASRYDRPVAAELHVLHDRGAVLRVVHTLAGPSAEHDGHLGDDLAAAAAELRRRTGVDRVVLVDRDGLSELAQPLAACGSPQVDQPTAFRRSHELFWASAAVVTDPEPPSWASWVALEEHLRALGDDYWALLAGYDGDLCAFTLLARFVTGQLTHLTSLQPVLGDARPPAEDVAALVAAAETTGPLPLVLVAPLHVLREVAVSPDLPTALSACVPQALYARGIPS